MFVTSQLLLAGHIACACAAVAAFWAAAAARKGSTGHVRTGKVYVAAMTALTVSALGLSALNVVAPEAVHSLEEFRARGTTLGADMSSATTADLAREFRLNAIWLTYAALQLLVGLRFGTQWSARGGLSGIGLGSRPRCRTSVASSPSWLGSPASSLPSWRA